MTIDFPKKLLERHTYISFGKPENLILKWMHSHWSKRRGRALLLKQLMKYLPSLNHVSLCIHNYKLPLDLRNDADIGYFFDVGIAHEKFYEQVLLSLIHNEAVFYDIGSNLGYYSLLLSPWTKQVYAFEPNPTLADRLVNAVKENVLENVDVFNIGLSNSSTQMTFYYDPSRHNLGSFLKSNSHMDSINVKVNTLDIIMEKEILLPADIIKIDTEGFELPVLEGYTTVQQQRPILLIEWDSEQEDSKNDKLISLIGMGYHIYKIGHDECLVPWEIKNYIGFSNLLLLPEQANQYPALQKWLK